MTTAALLDSTLRIMAIGQQLLIALVILRSAGPAALRLVTALMLLSVACYLVNSAPVFRGATGPADYVIELGSQYSTLLVWMFAHLLFERRIPRLLGIAACVAILGTWGVFVLGEGNLPQAEGRALNIVFHVIALCLAGHALLIAIAGRADDLVEKRRRFRQGFVIAVSVLAIFVLAAELAFTFDAVPMPLLLLQSTTVLALTTIFGWVMLRDDEELMAAAAPARQPASDALSPTEHVLHEKLKSAMEDGIYRNQGLTIGGLADQLSVPEHRLRALINQRLGYRNFSAYLNAFRIAEARKKLADPGFVDLPILTIAMDLGYGSLAPFNRAFRSIAGQAPSDYRRAAITGNRSSETEKS